MLFRHFCLVATAALLMTGCACSSGGKPTGKRGGGEIAEAAIPTKKGQQEVKQAIVILKPVKNNDVRGTITFTKVSGGVKIVADVQGLTPGKHGFHIHEHGDCGGEDAAAAGAHFNPTNSKHGGPDNPVRHVGDLGNLIADSSGHAYYERIDKVITLEGKNSIVGRSVIIHADEDDYTTQPAGASGAKISCGVIEAVTLR